MKPFRYFLIVFGVGILAIVPFLVTDLSRAQRSQAEFKRMMFVKRAVEEKVETYKQATGHYPDSMAALSFTNSPQEIEMIPDLKKIRYRHTGTSYDVGYDGTYGGYH